MGILKMAVWTVCAVTFGVLLSTYDFRGHSVLEHGKRLWKESPVPGAVGELTEHVEDTVENAKDKLRHDPKPHEHHSDQDRDALNKLIAKRGK